MSRTFQTRRPGSGTTTDTRTEHTDNGLVAVAPLCVDVHAHMIPDSIYKAQQGAAAFHGEGV